MLRIFPLLFILASTLGAAQDPYFVMHTPRTDYLFTEEVPPAYTLYSDVAMRDGPNMRAALVTTLPAGTKVSLEERGTDTLVHNGIGSAWYRAKAGKMEGWIWGGNIAQRSFGSTADPAVKFVAGIDHIVRPNGVDRIDFSYRIVALRAGKEVDRIVVRSFAWGYGDVKNNGNRGLKNVDDVITVDVPCVGGCGCATGEVVVFWCGGKFHHVTDLIGSPDGAFGTNVSFIYPADMEGQANTIIRVSSDYQDPSEEMKEGSDEDFVLRFVTRAYLQWNGQALIPHGEEKEVVSYRMKVD